MASTYAWLDPGSSRRSSFVLILFFGKRLPRKAAPRSASPPSALASSCPRHRRRLDPAGQRPAGGRHGHATEEARGRRTGRGGVRRTARSEPPPRRRPRSTTRSPPVVTRGHRGSRSRRRRGRTVGTLVDGLAVMMLFVVTLISLLVHIYSHRLRRRRPSLHPLLRVPQPVHRVDAAASCSPQNTLQMHRRLGAGRASARSCSSGTGGRRSRTPTPPSRRSSPTASATWACSSAMIILYFAAGRTFDIVHINEMADAGEIRPPAAAGRRRAA